MCHAFKSEQLLFQRSGGRSGSPRACRSKMISRQLGHAGYAITADVYAHVGHDAHREAADAMEAALHT
jgi:integrase